MSTAIHEQLFMSIGAAISRQPYCLLRILPQWEIHLSSGYLTSMMFRDSPQRSADNWT